jgi:hypothetical protein
MPTKPKVSPKTTQHADPLDARSNPEQAWRLMNPSKARKTFDRREVTRQHHLGE